MSVTIRLDRGVHRLAADLPLHYGGVLPAPALGWEIQGPAGAPLVLVMGGFSSSAHVAAAPADPTPGWWESLVGPGRALDTTRWRILGLDFLGGAGRSTGPDPGASELDDAFPRLTSHDQAAATAALLEGLDLGPLHAAVGASYGGMIALALAAGHPERVGRLVVISAAHDSHPWAQAMRGLQRRILRLGRGAASEREAVVLARALAMVTYRSPEEFQSRFDTRPTANPEWITFPVEEYLLSRGERFADDFDPAVFHALSRAIDLHRVEPEAIRVPVTLVAADTDRLVRPEQMRELADRLAGPTRYHEITSRVGHDAFLKEAEQLTPILERALSGGPDEA